MGVLRAIKQNRSNQFVELYANLTQDALGMGVFAA